MKSLRLQTNDEFLACYILEEMVPNLKGLQIHGSDCSRDILLRKAMECHPGLGRLRFAIEQYPAHLADPSQWVRHYTEDAQRVARDFPSLKWLGMDCTHTVARNELISINYSVSS